MAGFSTQGHSLERPFFCQRACNRPVFSGLAQNIPVFREVEPETGSIALNAGQNDQKFPSLLCLLSVFRDVRF